MEKKNEMRYMISVAYEDGHEAFGCKDIQSVNETLEELWKEALQNNDELDEETKPVFSEKNNGYAEYSLEDDYGNWTDITVTYKKIC